MNYVSMQFVMSLIVVAKCIGADIMDEHGHIIMVNSRTCNTNNEICYRYVVHGITIHHGKKNVMKIEVK